LETFPERGRQSNHIVKGLRLTTFNRKVIIAYRIVNSEVMILRILGPGRDIVAEVLRLD
jgi:plasmid stabilization system protein ParE